MTGDDNFGSGRGTGGFGGDDSFGSSGRTGGGLGMLFPPRTYKIASRLTHFIRSR